MHSTRIYLDHAATSWPKPEVVYQAVDQFAREVGVSAGRGQHGPALAAGRVVEQARHHLSQLLGASSPQQVALVSGGTAALNMALHGIVRPGDHVVTTATEHNSVLRPLHMLQSQGARVTWVDCDDYGYVDPREVVQRVAPDTRLVVVNHASNVTGAVQSIGEIGSLLRPLGIPLLVDAAQSLGTVEIDVQAMGVGLLAAPGHKGLLGPLGSGLLYVAPEWQDRIRPILQGGTGTHSEQASQPDEWPDRLEAGSLNTPAIAGLAAGAEYVSQQSVAKLAAQHQAQLADFLTAVASIAGLRLWGPRTATGRVGVVSLTLSTLEPLEVAAILESHFGIQSRAGLHCAPRMHGRLGTLSTGGTLRLSIGATSGPHDLTRAIAPLLELATM